MAVTFTIKNELNNGTGTVTLDFVYDILASEKDYPLTNENQFYFKMNTSKLAVGGAAIPVKIIKSLSELALNGASQSRTSTASAYASVTDMVEDYLYDFIHGHTLNQFGSGCSAQGAMNI